MKTAVELVNELGKPKALELMNHATCKHEDTLAVRKHRRRWGTNIRYKKCEHGVWVIDDYKPRYCPECHREAIRSKPTIGKDFQPYFDMGLGCYVETKQDRKRAMRTQGLEEAG